MSCRLACVCLLLWSCAPASQAQEDYVRELQEKAAQENKAEFGHWGWEADNYKLWGTHSNRLIPVYTFGTAGQGTGIDLNSYSGVNSPYRSSAALQKLFGQVPEGTLNPEATYLDQTNIYDLQAAALAAGKKQIILIVFDGMDWQTTRAASIFNAQRVQYSERRGTGLHMQDYTAGGTTQFGAMVTSPYADAYKVDVNLQTAIAEADTVRGGYAVGQAGPFPWSTAPELQYLVGKSADSRFKQAYTDSASSATSMTAGIKTYNASINVDHFGQPVATIAHRAQKRGYQIGVVTSVPISHATPAAAYGHNVDRDDYQDLTRDMLGLPSVSHPVAPLPGVDVLIGAGWGASREKDEAQGTNFVPGNAYLTAEDQQKIDVRSGGRYRIVQREAGVRGGPALLQAAQEAAETKQRMFGYFGAKNAHLPFQTADGQFNPPAGRKDAEKYSPEDITENPTLADMTTAALTYLQGMEQPFWLMVESGDVDWANHDNNIDNSIGAVLSGDAAVKVVTDWVETHSSWQDAVVIVTADHGHYLVLERPELLVRP